MKNKITKEAYEKLLKYLNRIKLYPVIDLLRENAGQLITATKPLKSIISEEFLRRCGACCFLTVAQYFKTGKYCSPYNYSYKDLDYSNEMTYFDVNLMLENPDEEVPENFGDGLSVFQREKIQFNFKYISQVIDQIANQYGYEKLTIEDFNSRSYTPAQMRKDCVIFTRGAQGPASHYDVIQIRNVDCMSSHTVAIYLKKEEL